MTKELSTEDLMTKGCDEYHARKDMESEISAREAIDNIGEVFTEFCNKNG